MTVVNARSCAQEISGNGNSIRVDIGNSSQSDDQAEVAIPGASFTKDDYTFHNPLVDSKSAAARRNSISQETLKEDPAEVLRFLHYSVHERARRRWHYLTLFCFVFYVVLYLVVLGLQKDAGGQYLLTSSMAKELVPDKMREATHISQDEVQDWLEDIVHKNWEELECGDGTCSHPVEYRAFGRFGCQADCGAHNTTFVRFVVMSNLARPEALDEVTFNLCHRVEEESPGKPLCWYKEDERFASLHDTVAHNVHLPDGEWEIKIRNIAGANGGVIAGVSVEGEGLHNIVPSPSSRSTTGGTTPHHRRILSIFGEDVQHDKDMMRKLKRLLLATELQDEVDTWHSQTDSSAGEQTEVYRGRQLLEEESVFDYAIESSAGGTRWARWQYERHHVIEQYNLQSYSLWSYEQCHQGALDAIDAINNSSLLCYLDWRPSSCCSFLSDLIYHECSCTDRLKLLAPIGVEYEDVEVCAARMNVPMVSGKLCPLASPVEQVPDTKKEANIVACHHIVNDLADSKPFQDFCYGEINTTQCCPLLYNFDKYNCECSDSFSKTDHITQLQYEDLFMTCAMDAQEHSGGRCDGGAAPVYVASSPQFANTYASWINQRTAVEYIHLQAQTVLDDDWAQHSRSTRVLLGLEVSCPEVALEPADCRTHMRRLLSSCESKSEDHTIACDEVCSAYLCDKHMSALCADTSMEWTSYAGDVFNSTYFQAWSSYKGVYEYQGCATCDDVDEECHQVSMETKHRLQYCTLQPESPCFWYGEGDQRASKAFDQLDAYFMDVGDDVVCAVSKGIRNKYGSIQNVSCDHIIEEFRTTDELFNIKCREDHHVGPCVIHADCGLGEFCGLKETEYGNSVCIDCVECCNPPNGNGLYWGSEPGCGHCVCSECSPGCTLSMRTNSMCDKACFTESCGWDNFRCYDELDNYQVMCPNEPGRYWEPVLYQSAEEQYALCCKMHDTFDSSIGFNLWNYHDEDNHRSYDLVPDSMQVNSSQGLRRFITNKNRVLVGMLLVMERYDKNGHCKAVEDYQEIYPNCVGHPLSEPYGIDPIFQFGTSLFDENLKERQSEYYEDHEVRSSGVPYGFHHHKIAGFKQHPAYPVLIDINLLPERAHELLIYLKEGHFLGFESHRLTTQLLTFNGNNGMFANIVVTMDFLLQGGIKVSHAVTGIVMELYLTPAHHVRAFLELVFVACYIFTVFGFCKDFMRNYKKTKSVLSYFDSGVSNVVECVSILLGASNILQWIDIVIQCSNVSIQERFDVYEDLQGEANWLKLANEGEGLRAAARQFHDISTLRLRWDYYMFFNAVNLTLMVVRVLNIMDFHPDIGLITRTLSTAAHDLANYCVVTTVLVSVYACMGHIFFGDQIIHMSTLRKASSTCMYFMIGNFLDSDTWATNMNTFSSITLSLWFWSYVTIVFIILLSAVLAIIVSAMDKIKRDDAHRERTNLFLEMAQILTFCADSIRRRFKNRMTELAVEKKLKDMITSLQDNKDLQKNARPVSLAPIMKAIPIGTTTLHEEQLEKLLCSAAETYVASRRGSFFDRTQLSIQETLPANDIVKHSGEMDTAPMTNFSLKTREMANVLFTSLAKQTSDELAESQEWLKASQNEAKWKAEVLALLTSIKEHTAVMSDPAGGPAPISNHTPDPWSRNLRASASTIPSAAHRVCSTKVELPRIKTRNEVKGKSIDLTDARKSLELAKKSLEMSRSDALVPGNHVTKDQKSKGSAESAPSPVRRWAE